MKQDTFNTLMRGLIFASCADTCADVEAFDGMITAIAEFKEEFSDFDCDLDLSGVYLFGDGDGSEEPEKYNALIKLFGEKLDVQN